MRRRRRAESACRIPRITSDAKHVEIGLTDKADSMRALLDDAGPQRGGSRTAAGPRGRARPAGRPGRQRRANARPGHGAVLRRLGRGGAARRAAGCAPPRRRSGSHPARSSTSSSPAPSRVACRASTGTRGGWSSRAGQTRTASAWRRRCSRCPRAGWRPAGSSRRAQQRRGSASPRPGCTPGRAARTACWPGPPGWTPTSPGRPGIGAHLDLRTGVLLREEATHGRGAGWRSLRLASAARPGVVALRTEAPLRIRGGRAAGATR